MTIFTGDIEATRGGPARHRGSVFLLVTVRQDPVDR
jgi:hypothetical protein